jgi:hypothetical protein
MSNSSYVELQQQNNNVDEENPPQENNNPRNRTISTQKIHFCIGLILLIIAIIIYNILSPYSDSVACPDCNTFCGKCNCAIINGTLSHQQICEKCASCVAGECSNFAHDVSKNFVDVFWYVGLIGWLMVILNVGPDSNERRN